MKIYGPFIGGTGTLTEQPHTEQMQPCAWADLTADCEVLFDHRGALDAPANLPSGGMRALDLAAFRGSSGIEVPAIRILVATVWREGVRS